MLITMIVLLVVVLFCAIEKDVEERKVKVEALNITSCVAEQGDYVNDFGQHVKVVLFSDLKEWLSKNRDKRIVSTLGINNDDHGRIVAVMMTYEEKR